VSRKTVGEAFRAFRTFAFFTSIDLLNHVQNPDVEYRLENCGYAGGCTARQILRSAPRRLSSPQGLNMRRLHA
jgi:hypothetical protein